MAATASTPAGRQPATGRPPPGLRRNCKPVIGYAYLHTALDDHSWLAYTEILCDERQETAAWFWQRAHAYFSACGIGVQRVLTDNGPAYKSRLWRHTVTSTGAKPKWTKAYRPLLTC